MTLMACYGAPPCEEDECFEDSDEIGESEEECNPQVTPLELDASSVPATIMGSLDTGPGGDQGSCGGEGDERVYLWTPPGPGTYRLSVSATLDTVLYLRVPEDGDVGSCGQELTCGDDYAGSQGPSVLVTRDSTEPVLVVVDAVDFGGGGEFVLTIEEQ